MTNTKSTRKHQAPEFVMGRRGPSIQQKPGPMADRRTKRNRTRSDQTRHAVARSYRGE